MQSLNNLINELNSNYKLEIEVNKFYYMAFMHSSYINEHKSLEKHEHYERLEFLGDAVLELATSEFLYSKFSNMAEGDLTKIRASVVCEPTLVKYATKLNFGKYMYLGKGEEKTGGRTRDALLADIFESFIGALYLDKGLTGVKVFLENTLFQEINDSDYYGFIDYKTLLQEYVSKKKIGDISYELVSSFGPSHDKTFESKILIDNKAYGQGQAKTKKQSEQLAAKEALTILKYF